MDKTRRKDHGQKFTDRDGYEFRRRGDGDADRHHVSRFSRCKAGVRENRGGAKTSEFCRFRNEPQP